MGKKGKKKTAQPSDSVHCCWICLQEGADDQGMPLTRGCSCRGDDAGFAHVSCLVSFARTRFDRAMKEEHTRHHEELNAIWQKCPTCKQEYQGDVALAIADKRLIMVEEDTSITETDFVYLITLIHVGTTKVLQSDYKEDLVVAGIQTLERLIQIVEANVEDSDSNIWDTNHIVYDAKKMLAGIYISTGRDPEKGRKYLQQIKNGTSLLASLQQLLGGKDDQISALTTLYEDYVEKAGKDDFDTLCAAIQLGSALKEREEYEKAYPILEDTYIRSTRVLGKQHELTVDSKEKYFHVAARCGTRKATLSTNDPQLNGNEVTVLKATKDGAKYVVKDRSGDKFKALPRQLVFAEGTFVRVNFGFGWVDSFDKEENSYTVCIMNRVSLDELAVVPREMLNVVFLSS